MILLVVCLLGVTLVCNVSASAHSVSADNVTAKSGESIRIPVKISGNAGIMGFKFSVEYSTEVFNNPKVSRGTVTSEGTFDSSISENTTEKFDIIWNHVSDIKEDGVIFILEFDVVKTVKNGTYPIKLTYSQADTFNEKWEDVVLSVKDINVTITDETGQNETETQTQITTETSQNQTDKSENAESFIEEVIDKVDSDYIQNTIEDALENVGEDQIESIDKNQFEEFKNYVDNSFDDYGVDIENKPENNKDYEQLYDIAVKENFADTVLSVLDEKTVSSVIEDMLKTYEVETIDQLKNEQIDSFVEDIIKEFKDKGVDINNDSLGKSDKLQVIESLYEKVKTTLNNDGDKYNDLLIYSCVIIGVCAISISIFIVIKYRKQRKTVNEA